MVKAREPPKKGVALVIGQYRYCTCIFAGTGNSYSKGYIIIEACGWAYCVSIRPGGGRMPAGAMREGRYSVYVPMAGQEQGSRRATVRREERGTEGRARTNKRRYPYLAYAMYVVL
jgi:hypothetical protein